jgi:hypothetical protein
MINVEKLSDIDVYAVLDDVRRDSYQVIRGLLNVEEINAGVARFKAKFNAAYDNGSLDIRPEQIMGNFQKWAAGMMSPKSTSLARLFRCFYNPLWCEDIYSLHSSFNALVELRNYLQGIDLNYAKNVEKNGLYSAVRIQNYPIGGGFMQAHTDYIGVDNLERTDVKKFVQVLLVMSEKGVDYERGGAFIERDGQRIFTEEGCRIGDVVVYDGATVHGVEDIDPHLPLKTDEVNGRIAGFATIYKKWS